MAGRMHTTTAYAHLTQQRAGEAFYYIAAAAAALGGRMHHTMCITTSGVTRGAKTGADGCLCTCSAHTSGLGGISGREVLHHGVESACT